MQYISYALAYDPISLYQDIPKIESPITKTGATFNEYLDWMQDRDTSIEALRRIEDRRGDSDTFKNVEAGLFAGLVVDQIAILSILNFTPIYFCLSFLNNFLKYMLIAGTIFLFFSATGFLFTRVTERKLIWIL